MKDSVSQTPFLRILEPENLSRIKIDDELIPAFRIIILKINDYFIKNGLMDAKDWDSFFDEYLFSESEKQLKIEVCEQLENGTLAQGEYLKDKSKINIRPAKKFTSVSFCHKLCHEFVHFLVMADSYPEKLSRAMVLNEGMTELLTRNIIGSFQTHYESYPDEVAIADFYCKISNGRHFKSFLNDEYYFDISNPMIIDYLYSDFEKKADDYCDSKSDIGLIKIQRQIIEFATNINYSSFTSLDDFINAIIKLNQRPYNDEKYMETVYRKFINYYLHNLNLPEVEKKDLADKLLQLCKISRKAQIYGDVEVAEFRIDDFYVAYDREGRFYSDDKLRYFLPSREYIVYKDKDFKTETRYDLDLDNTNNYTNWYKVYNHYLTQIRKMIDINYEELIFDEEYEREKQRIMRARFSDEDKQRMLQELEEEYIGNLFGNNSNGIIRK